MDDDAIARSLGQTIRRLRTGLGWSQADLAERIETSVEYVSMLERAARGPSLRTLLRLSAAFEVTVDELLGKQRPKRTGDEGLVALARAIPVEARPLVTRMLRAVCEPNLPYRQRGAKRESKRKAS